MNTDLVDDKEVIFVVESSYPITSTVVMFNELEKFNPQIILNLGVSKLNQNR